MKVKQKLIERSKLNDREAQKQLYSQLVPYLAAVCRRYLRNESDIQDALQEAFVNVFRHIEKYDSSKAEFKTWAVRIAINATLKLNHKMYHMKTVEFVTHQHELSEDPLVLNQLNNEELMRQMKEMPGDFYEVFNMYVVDGFTHKEIGEMINVDESLSRKRLSRAREWISQHMKPEMTDLLEVKRVK